MVLQPSKRVEATKSDTGHTRDRATVAYDTEVRQSYIAYDSAIACV